MTTRPHDALFKEVFSDLDNARGELAAVLPAEVTAIVEWDTLHLEPGTYVDAALRETMSDLVFSVRIRGRDARLHLLFEHQSSPDPWMPLRALEYVVRIWRAWLVKNRGARALPPVIPVVLAQVEAGWGTIRELADVIDFADDAERSALGTLVPQCRLLVDDLALVSDDALDARAMPNAAKLALAALRDVRASSDLLATLRTWARWIAGIRSTAGGDRVWRRLVRYILQAPQAPMIEDIERVVTTIDEDAGSEIMTTARELIQQGRVEGRAEVLLKLIQLRFGPPSAETVARVRGSAPEVVDRWVERILTAPSVDELLRS